MKVKVGFIKFILIAVLMSCNQEYKCQNRFDLVNSADDLPILDLLSYDSKELILEKMIEHYGEERCDCNAELPIKVPYQFELGAGYLNVILILEEVYDPTCPIICSVYPNQYNLDIQRNGVVFDNEYKNVIESDTLRQRILRYFASVGKSDYAPFNFKKAGVGISLYSKNNNNQLNQLFMVIENAYISFIHDEFEKKQIKICNLSREEIKVLKKKYPLNIRVKIQSEQVSVPPPPMILEEIAVEDSLIELSYDINLEEFFNK
ncbi:hypothetical protein [Crocinitomix catalasitica]|uniref:hypothetical protein n=1 Tax=Crocinitomix catalasitica TaxID=184607 RepID=UPI000482E56A|nr:hypothetical protein [Crocinitomix catalasitica]